MRRLIRLFSVVVVMTLVIGPLAVRSSQAQGDDEYTVTVVGGVDQSEAFDDQTVDGFAFSGMDYRSNYPSGMEFRVTITAPEGVTVDRVTLFYTFSTGKTGRVAAEHGETENEWIARPFEQRGMTPWHQLNVVWGARTTDGQSVDSEPLAAVYYDPTREWYRAESADVEVYWFDMPEDLGRYVIDMMAQNHDRYIAGFGAILPYRPVAIIYPPGAVWNEYRGDSSIDDTQLGFTGTTISEAGSTVQRVRTLEPAEIRETCIWNPETPSVEFQMNMAASTTTHEVAHLYQEEFGVQRGPDWWIEGQASFFEPFEEYPVHERLRTLAELRGGDLPSFHGAGPGGGALTAAEDGCTHLIYDMGNSFMRWIVEYHGGMETYRAIVDGLAHNATLEESLEAATGVPFLDLENEWRAFLGVDPVAAEVLDPSLLLSDPAEPFYAVGDQVTLPGTPFQQPIYSEPSTTSVGSAACFANTALTIQRAGNDGTVNWYEVDCMGMIGWMNQAQLGTNP
jgi:hypothetical protein